MGKNLPAVKQHLPLVTALQGSVIAQTRSIAKLQSKVIDEVLETREELESELESLRNDWRWVKKNLSEKHGVADGLRLIEEKAAVIKEKISRLPNYITMRERAEHDLDNLTDDVMLTIAWLSTQLNISGGMNEEQIMMAATSIVEKFGTLTLEDIAVAFKYAIEGRYGTLYNRVDIAVLNEWLTKYTNEKADRHYDKMEMHNLNHKSEVRLRSEKHLSTEEKSPENIKRLIDDSLGREFKKSK